MIYADMYTIQKEDPILLYGAATTGAILYGNLTDAGYRVAAFIDQRAHEIDSYYGLPVWDPAAAGRYAEQYAAVVIIAIKNVFEHERIAESLWNLGFEKIIFRPYRSVCGEETETERMLNTAYDRIISREGIVNIPACPAVTGRERQTLKDHAVILDQGDYVTANIFAPYVFTDYHENEEVLWGDIPCLGLLPHLGLFDLFNGNWNPDYAEYMKYCRQAAEESGGIVTSKAWEASVYRNRMDVFNHMEYSWEHDRNFFVRNAVEGCYNPKGYFNIRSGKHRITYLLAKGSRYLPLRIKKADYAVWRRREQASRVAELLWKTRWEILPAALVNPYLYDQAGGTPAFYEKILFSLLTGIFKDALHSGNALCFRGKTILFSKTSMALYADIFQILGFEIFVHERNSFREQLNEAVLSGVPVQHLETLEKGPETYDLAILEGASSAGTAPARITVTVSGEMRPGESLLACGVTGDRVQYAFSNVAF